MKSFEIKNVIFTALKTDLVTAHPGCFVSGEYTETPSAFPAITVEEKNNEVYQKATTDFIDNAAKLMYEINVYTNSAGYREKHAREIMGTIDAKMSSLGFTRIMCNPIPNIADSTIYRLVARYEGVAFDESTATTGKYRIYQK